MSNLRGTIFFFKSNLNLKKKNHKIDITSLFFRKCIQIFGEKPFHLSMKKIYCHTRVKFFFFYVEFQFWGNLFLGGSARIKSHILGFKKVVGKKL